MTQELTELTNRIMEAARKEAQKETASSQAEAQRLAAEYQLETAKMGAALREEYQRRGKEEAARMIREAEMEAKLRLLQNKQELIHNAFEQALSTLTNLPGEEKTKLYRELLLAAVEDGEESIAVAAAEKELWAKVITQVNKELDQNGRRGNLKLKREPAAIKGGFLLYSATYEMNASLESIVRDLEERFFPEVAGILFS